jgi:hypothetical protein
MRLLSDQCLQSVFVAHIYPKTFNGSFAGALSM